MSSSSNSTSYLLTLVICGISLAACSEQEVVSEPAPATLTRDDVGYFCGMIVEDHLGPKSQIILKDQHQVLWFTTARDGIAFQRLPEETRPILAFYVSALDLGGWNHPESDPANMIKAGQAWFVIDSKRSGSMGAPETIPFFNEQAASRFVEEFGGKVLSLDDIPDNYILGPPPSTSSTEPTGKF